MADVRLELAAEERGCGDRYRDAACSSGARGGLGGDVQRMSRRLVGLSERDITATHALVMPVNWFTPFFHEFLESALWARISARLAWKRGQRGRRDIAYRGMSRGVQRSISHTLKVASLPGWRDPCSASHACSWSRNTLQVVRRRLSDVSFSHNSPLASHSRRGAVNPGGPFVGYARDAPDRVYGHRSESPFTGMTRPCFRSHGNSSADVCPRNAGILLTWYVYASVSWSHVVLAWAAAITRKAVSSFMLRQTKQRMVWRAVARLVDIRKVVVAAHASRRAPFGRCVLRRVHLGEPPIAMCRSPCNERVFASSSTSRLAC